MTPAEKEQKRLESKIELIKNPGSVCKFIINKNYKDVYQIEKTLMLQAGLNPDDFTGDVHTDTRQAEISIGGGAIIIRYIEIKALSEETTEYTSYYFYKWKYEQHAQKYCYELKQSIEEYKTK
jgi:hypothetical protein